jgi:hypothetical protein
VDKRKPVHQKAQEENNNGPFKNFTQYLRLRKFGPFFHYKTHSIADRKHKGRKYKIGWGKSIPGSMK